MPVRSIALTNREDLQGKVSTTSRAGYAAALDISSYSLIALANSLVGVLSDGSSIPRHWRSTGFLEKTAASSTAVYLASDPRAVTSDAHFVDAGFTRWEDAQDD